MNSSDITPGFRLVGGIIRAAVGLFCVILGTVILFISIGEPFSWLMVTVVVLLYVKGLFAWLFAFRFLKGNSSTEWNTLLSPLGWKVSAIGFGAVALLFAFSAAAGEGSWLITGTLVYTALAMICLFAASNSIPEKPKAHGLRSSHQRFRRFVNISPQLSGGVSLTMLPRAAGNSVLG